MIMIHFEMTTIKRDYDCIEISLEKSLLTSKDLRAVKLQLQL